MKDGLDARLPPGMLMVETATSDVVIGTWNNVAVGIWKSPTAETFRAFMRCQDKLAGENPSGIFAMSIIEEGSPMPSRDARKQLADLVMAEKGRVILSAVVPEGSGFRAAAVRAVSGAMMVLSKPPFPQEVFSTVRDACQWFDRQAPKKVWRGERLLEAVNATRAQRPR
jgi:hypothetical protein